MSEEEACPSLKYIRATPFRLRVFTVIIHSTEKQEDTNKKHVKLITGETFIC